MNRTMRWTMRWTLALAALSWMVSPAGAQLVITEVQPSSEHSEDWFELTNTGAVSVDLENYYWDDDGPTGNDGALFPAISIAPSQSVVFARYASADDLPLDDADFPAFVSSWGGGFPAYSEASFGGNDTFSGLSSGGDQIEIWDGDPNPSGGTAVNLVASVVFGAAPGDGRTFAWDTQGNFLGLSAVGVHGAYQALHDGGGVFPSSDIGSPGTAVVPEPTSAALVALGLLALLGARRL